MNPIEIAALLVGIAWTRAPDFGNLFERTGPPRQNRFLESTSKIFRDGIDQPGVGRERERRDQGVHDRELRDAAVKLLEGEVVPVV